MAGVFLSASQSRKSLSVTSSMQYALCVSFQSSNEDICTAMVQTANVGAAWPLNGIGSAFLNANPALLTIMSIFGCVAAIHYEQYNRRCAVVPFNVIECQSYEQAKQTVAKVAMLSGFDKSST